MQRQQSAEIDSPAAPASNDDGQAMAPAAGEPFTVGTGFKALSLKHAMFGGLMDPLVMVDHYTMTEPTFGAHAHAGMSAVTVLFEDSKGAFNNRDSLGNDIDLQPGDLYWLNAGSGAVHDEKPVPGAVAHGLQMFVNLPARLKHRTPETLHVTADTMPLIESSGARVRVVLGQSNGLIGASSPALPMTILDAKIEPSGHFEHQVAAGHSQWIYAVKGSIELSDGTAFVTVKAGEALAARAMPDSAILTMRAHTDSHAVIVTGEPINEAFVQRGPFVMSTEAEIAEIEAAYREGRLGKLDSRQKPS